MSLRTRLQFAKNALVNTLQRARSHYRITFSGRSGEYVLKDLAKFTQYHGDPFRESQRETDYMLGERRVMLRILGMLNMDDEMIAELTRGEDEDE